MGRPKSPGFRRRRRRILEIQSFRCFYCTKRLEYGAATADHVTPQAYGGLHGEDNIVVACYRCNTDRGTMPVTRVLSITNPLATLPQGDKWKNTRAMLVDWTRVELRKQRRKYDKESIAACVRSSCPRSAIPFCNATSQAPKS